MMSLGSILSLILANHTQIEETVAGIINMYKATTAPAPVTVPSTPATGTNPALPAVKKAPSEAIKSLQTLLNTFVKPEPPLVADGWLGAKTEAAIATAIPMLQPYLAMLGK